MPVSVSHALSATTPNDPTYEIRPEHWNSNHIATISAVGSEIIGAFSNDPAVNVSFSTNAGGFVIASANVTAAPSPVNVTGANGSSVNAQTIAFSNSNGMTLGVSTAANGATVTGSYTVPTVPTAYVSSVNGSSGAISLNVGSSLSSSTNGSSITFGLASNITTALQSAGAYLTTAALSNHSHGFSAAGGSSAFQTLSFSNGGGVSFTNTNGQVGATVATTYRASNDAIGTSTANSNVTWTANSSGLSLDARGYAGTATVITGNASITLNSGGLSFNGSNLAGVGTSATNASITLNSNGLAISIAAGGGATPVVSAANGSYSFTTLSLSNANGFSFGTSAGSAITGSYTVPSVTEYFSKTNTTFNGANISGSLTLNTAGLQMSLSVAAPGAAAENNNINLLGANTSGNTTASGSTIGWSGINLTLSGTNNSIVNISAPATSSLVGSSGLSISTNGSTITAYAIARSEWNNIFGLAAAPAQQGQSLVSVQPFMLEWPLVASNVMFPMSIAVGTQTNTSSGYFDISASGVVYTRNVSTLSSLFSFSQTATVSFSSNATGTVGGIKALSATFAGTTMTPGNYWLALHVSTTNSATGGANTTALGNTISMVLGYGVSSNQQGFMYMGGATNNSLGLMSGMGLASTGATRASYDLSAITVTGTRAGAAPVAFGLRNDTYQ